MSKENKNNKNSQRTKKSFSAPGNGRVLPVPEVGKRKPITPKKDK